MTVVDARLLHKVRDDCRYALRDLCEPQKRTIWREDGTVSAHHAVSLLKQLREEVANSSSRGGRRKSSNSSPLGVDALDLWDQVRAGALYLAASTGAHLDRQPDGAPDTAAVEHAIRQAVAAAAGLSDVEAVLGVRNALEGWVKAIRALLNPAKRVPLWGRSCPVQACGESTVWRRDESDGEVKRTAALEIVMEEDRSATLAAKEARCLACCEVWPRDRLLELADAMGLAIPGMEEGNPAA